MLNVDWSRHYCLVVYIGRTHGVIRCWGRSRDRMFVCCEGAHSGLSSNWGVGLETSASAEVKSILSDTCVVENTDVKVICSIKGSK